MSRHAYQVGDKVVLKSGAFRRGETESECRIVSTLPEAYGQVQYRVRFESENCERRVTEADIDGDASTSAAGRQKPLATASGGGSWVNLNAIRIKK